MSNRVVQLWSKTFNHQIHLPAPQTRENAVNHLRQLPPQLLENMVIRELEVVSETSAEDALRDTIPCPAPTAEAAE